MYKIGEFSILTKTTVKTLRYYEKEGLLVPEHIDEENGYRYYSTKQLIDVSKIVELRQVGLSIKDIHNILSGCSVEDYLRKRESEIREELRVYDVQLSKVKYLLEGEHMKNEIVLKELEACSVYYKEGVVDNFGGLSTFIKEAKEEYLNLNPNGKLVSPNYCFVSYLDGEYKETNIKVEYCEAVVEVGEKSEQIKFKNLSRVSAVCTYHKGSYTNLAESYAAVMGYIESNGYKIIDSPREFYIDGAWNKENEEDFLTEIQFPVQKN